MANDEIADSQLTASSVYSGHGGLEIDKARLNGPGAWCVAHSNQQQWLQVDLQNMTIVTGVITQGRSSQLQYVRFYWVEYTQDGSSWISVSDGKVS